MNGHAEHGNSETHAQILRALELVHDPRSSNELRQNASRYLEEIRSNEEAPSHGFGLALSKEQPPIVRHYGLSLLEYAVRHRWSDLNAEQSKLLREWVVGLSQNTTDGDPPYITNKVAEMWVEIAKRSWGLGWMNMDELLVGLWAGSLSQKILVLKILETLSDEVFGSDDVTAALRGNELNKACVEIFTPANVLTEQFPKRETTVDHRFGSEGWLTRIADLLEWCTRDGKIDADQQVCTVRALVTFKSVISWVIPRALVATHSVYRICACLAASSMPVQLVFIYLRTQFWDEKPTDYGRLLSILYTPYSTAPAFLKMISGT